MSQKFKAVTGLESFEKSVRLGMSTEQGTAPAVETQPLVLTNHRAQFFVGKAPAPEAK